LPGARERSEQGWEAGQNLFGDFSTYSNPDIGRWQGREEEAWDWGKQPLSDRVIDALYGGGLYKKAVEGEHGLYDDPTYEAMIGEAAGVTKSFGERLQENIRLGNVRGGGFAPGGAAAAQRAIGLQSGKDAAEAATGARLGLERDIVGQRERGARGLTGAGTAEEGLTQSRFGTGAGIASRYAGLSNEARSLQESNRRFGASGLEEMRQTGQMSREEENLLTMMMQTWGLDLDTAATLLGIRTGSTPDQSPWWGILQSFMSGAGQAGGAAAGAAAAGG
jgi:hypothetical protein